MRDAPDRGKYRQAAKPALVSTLEKGQNLVSYSARSQCCFLLAMIGSRRVHLPVAIVSIGREGQQLGRAS
jgi:hypothetical protein